LSDIITSPLDAAEAVAGTLHLQREPPDAEQIGGESRPIILNATSSSASRKEINRRGMAWAGSSSKQSRRRMAETPQRGI
jgi:hypothetical protein